MIVGNLIGKLFGKMRDRGGRTLSPNVLTLDEVVWAYRLFLDREPESLEMVQEKAKRLKSQSELREDFMRSEEFRHNNPAFHFGGMSGDEPAMHID